MANVTANKRAGAPVRQLPLKHMFVDVRGIHNDERKDGRRLSISGCGILWHAKPRRLWHAVTRRS